MSIAYTEELAQLSILNTSNETVTLLADEFEEMVGELAQYHDLVEQQAEEIQVLQQQLADARMREKREGEARERAEEDSAYVRELAAIDNQIMGPSEKWTLWASREVINAVGREAEQVTEIRLHDLQKRTGMSRYTVGANIRTLAEKGAIAREEAKELVEGKNGGKKWNTQLSIGRTLLTDSPSALVTSKPRNNGGKREVVVCEDCGGENVDIYQAYECRCCGKISQAKLEKKQTGRKGKVSKITPTNEEITGLQIATPLNNSDTPF